MIAQPNPGSVLRAKSYSFGPSTYSTYGCVRAEMGDLIISAAVALIEKPARMFDAVFAERG